MGKCKPWKPSYYYKFYRIYRSYLNQYLTAREKRELLLRPLESTGWGVDIAFVYLDTTPAPYEVINEKMTQLLNRIATAAAEQQFSTQEDEK